MRLVHVSPYFSLYARQFTTQTIWQMLSWRQTARTQELWLHKLCKVSFDCNKCRYSVNHRIHGQLDEMSVVQWLSLRSAHSRLNSLSHRNSSFRREYDCCSACLQRIRQRMEWYSSIEHYCIVNTNCAAFISSFSHNRLIRLVIDEFTFHRFNIYAVVP